MNACKSSSVDCQVVPRLPRCNSLDDKIKNAQEYSTYSVMLKFVQVPYIIIGAVLTDATLHYVS